MIICHYCFGLPPYKTGGAPMYVNHLIDLQSKSNDVVLLYPGHYRFFRRKSIVKSGGLYKKDNRIKSFEIINPKPIPICNGITNIYYYTKNYPIEMWDAFFSKQKIDVLHIHTLFGLDKNMVESCKKHNIKTIFTTHDLFGICPKVVPLFKPICNLRPTDLCSECSKYAFSIKQVRLMQSRLYSIIKNLFLIKLFRRKKLKQRVANQANISAINSEKLICLLNNNSKKYSELQKYYIEIIESFDCVHFNSSLSQSVFLERSHPKNSFVKIINNGKIIDRRQTHIKQLDHNLITFLFLGTGKGLYEIINCLDDLWQHGMKNFKLVVYSNNDCEYKEFIEKHPAYSIEDEEKIFNSADCLLLYETSFASLSFIVLESLSYGLPCITCGDIGANQVVSETNGGIVSSKDLFKDTLISVLKDKDLIAKWQDNLKKSTFSVFDDDFTAAYRKYLEIKND